MRLILAVAGAVVLLLAAVLVSATVGMGLRPLTRMTGLARSITSGDRGRRLRPDRPDTELGRTAHAFDDMLDALEGAERHARRAESGMRDLLSDAAHELRTPLAAVRASVETVLRTDPARAPREELLAAAIRELGRSGRLVTDLLDIARLEAPNRPPLNRQTTDLLALTHRVATTLPAAGPHPTITGVAVLACVDPDRIGQVLDNLLRNAARAAGPTSHINATVTTTGANAVIDITDNGPGVPEADRERIFNRLVRLDPARSRDGGAGLGLPIARALARAHGGDVTCLPTRHGAHFTIRLPGTNNPRQPHRQTPLPPATEVSGPLPTAPGNLSTTRGHP